MRASGDIGLCGTAAPFRRFMQPPATTLGDHCAAAPRANPPSSELPSLPPAFPPSARRCPSWLIASPQVIAALEHYSDQRRPRKDCCNTFVLSDISMRPPCSLPRAVPLRTARSGNRAAAVFSSLVHPGDATSRGSHHHPALSSPSFVRACRSLRRCARSRRGRVFPRRPPRCGRLRRGKVRVALRSAAAFRRCWAG